MGSEHGLKDSSWDPLGMGVLFQGSCQWFVKLHRIQLTTVFRKVSTLKVQK